MTFEFDPKDQPLTLESAVFQSLGAASVCWENMTGTGVFLDAEAKHVGETLIAAIRSGNLVDSDDSLPETNGSVIRATFPIHEASAGPGFGPGPVTGHYSLILSRQNHHSTILGGNVFPWVSVDAPSDRYADEDWDSHEVLLRIPASSPDPDHA